MSKYKLPFVLNNKEFEIPKMTVKLQEKAMDKMKEYDKLEEHKYGRIFNKNIILLSLQQIDSNVKIDDIENMHPDDYLNLFQLIWNSGKITKGDRKFRE